MKNFDLPKITFGIIVVNGEPFTRYCLRSLYPYAHEIIVVEGGHEDAKSVCTPDGHSVDGTLEELYKFKREEDPQNKLTIVTRNGFWPKTDELGRHRTPQSRAYAERATGDYLWQIDIDEFYKDEDMQAIIEILTADPSITAVTFPTRNFWGDTIYKIDGWNLRRGAVNFHRLFKWGKGFQYVTHEPPTINNEKGIDLRSIHWITGNQMKRRGIYMYHYPFLFPWQVKQKTLIYKDEKPELCADILEWANNNYYKITNPFNIERHYWYPSWLEYYRGSHPKEVLNMMNDVRSGKITIDLRENSDVEKILGERFYTVKTTFMKVKNIWNIKYKYYKFQFSRIKNIPGRIKRNINRLTTHFF
ncbi:MAG: hypothetical protein Q7U54_15150 [Bacteroidales bacterium]|nr:hypothetical protein [Bacteroidales bacterium]